MAAPLFFSPVTLLPIYFLKLPNCQPAWGVIGALVLVLGVLLLLCRFRESPVLDQLLLKRSKKQKLFSLAQRLLQYDLPLVLIGAAVGFHLGIHSSILWTSWSKCWAIALCMAAYAVTCACSLFFLVTVQFVRDVQLLVLTPEYMLRKPLSAKKGLLRIVGLFAASEVAGIIGIAYVGSFVLLGWMGLQMYDLYQQYADTDLMYWGIRALGAGFVLMICCNAVAFVMLKRLRRRRKEEEEEKEEEDLH